MEYSKRYTIKAFDQEGDRPLELSRPGNMKSHPWSYMELPFDPEYELYNNRMTPASLNYITPDEQYWAVRTGVILFREAGVILLLYSSYSGSKGNSIYDQG